MATPREQGDSPATTVLKVGAFGGAVYLGYLLFTNLRIGGSGIGGPGNTPQTGPDDGRSGAPAPDPAPLELRIRAKDGNLEQTELVLEGAPVTIEAVIARVLRGGRSDITVIPAGNAKQRDIDAALAALRAAGLTTLTRETPIVSGSRGVYRHSTTRWGRG